MSLKVKKRDIQGLVNYCEDFQPAKTAEHVDKMS